MIKRYAQFRRRWALRQARWWDEYPGRMTALVAAAIVVKLYNACVRYQQNARVKKLIDLSKRVDVARDARRRVEANQARRDEAEAQRLVNHAETQRLANQAWQERH